MSGACYTFGPSGVDYVTASQYCLSRGLMMAEIHAEEDQRNIEDLIRGTKVMIDNFTTDGAVCALCDANSSKCGANFFLYNFHLFF